MLLESFKDLLVVSLLLVASKTVPSSFLLLAAIKDLPGGHLIGPRRSLGRGATHESDDAAHPEPIYA